jgi:glutamine synthetase
VLPAGEKQLQQSAEAAKVIESAAGKNLPLAKRLGCLGAVVGEVAASVDKLQSLLGRVDQMHDETAEARVLADEVRPAMAAAREAADKLEQLVDDALWSLPKYREMLFVK